MTPGTGLPCVREGQAGVGLGRRRQSPSQLLSLKMEQLRPGEAEQLAQTTLEARPDGRGWGTLSRLTVPDPARAKCSRQVSKVSQGRSPLGWPHRSSCTDG